MSFDVIFRRISSSPYFQRFFKHVTFLSWFTLVHDATPQKKTHQTSIAENTANRFVPIGKLFCYFFQEDFHGFNDEELAAYAQNTKENLEILQEDFHGFQDEELKIFRQKTEQSLKLINQAIKKVSETSPVKVSSPKKALNTVSVRKMQNCFVF